ncbi:MAG: lycopene cyclase family protein [Chloroflexota bacterium]
MKTFNFIIAGGGAAGLSLAVRLQRAFPDKSILVVDRQPKTSNDRTWCFWSKDPSPYPAATYRTWQELAFFGKNFSKVFSLHPYYYYLIRGIDLYHHTYSLLNSSPQVQFEFGEITHLQEAENFVTLFVNDQNFQGEWIFSSLYDPQRIKPQPQKYHYLKQHFRGWEIETEAAAFDPQTPTLFDFRIPQNGQMRFMYILPFSEHRALIEYTLFSTDLLPDEEYNLNLQQYIHRQLGIKEFQIGQVENGVIPMTDHPLPRRLGQRILAIGTLGGRVKPSSGYAFLRIQRDSDAIVESLLKNGHPFELPDSPSRYRLFDSIMLQVMLRNGNQMDEVFTQLFKNNPIQRIFAFLDENQTFTGDLKVLASLPPLPFLLALLRLKVLRRI